MEENTNKGLTKKTKSELIEIILRKDDIERECRSKINSLKEDLDYCKRKYEEVLKRYEEVLKQYNEDKYIIDKQKELLIEKENLIIDMQSEFDKTATEIAEAKEETAKYKLYVKGLSFICIILIVILTFKLLVF